MLLVNELFSGIGTQALALEYLGIPHKIVGVSEIEKNAIEVYNVLHGETRNYGDVSKIEKLDYADLWTYSFPCFPGDTPILTEKGYKRIDSIKKGDKVYTHTGKLRSVVKTFDNGEHLICNLYIDELGVLETTSNHKFLVYQKGHLDWVACDSIEIGSHICLYKGGLEGLGVTDKESIQVHNFKGYQEYVDLYIFRTVKSIGYTSDIKRVYDIEVEKDHSFIAKGVVAHNCQDLSSGGKGKGIAAVDEMGNAVATRSGLLWQVERLLARSCGYDIEQGLLVENKSYEKNPPKYLLLENVPELVNVKKHRIHFDKWCHRLEELGYRTSIGVLNGYDFGVPQNRERVFCLSIRKDIYSEEIDYPYVNSFDEPPKHSNLEDYVDKQVLEYTGDLMIDPTISNYLLPAYNRDLKAISECSKDPLMRKSIWTCECKSGFQDHRVGITCAPTIRHQNQHTAIFVNNQIHKLTACECWKFMGIKEEDFWKVKNNTKISDNILCGLAGNAIVVPVLMSLFNQIWRIEQGLEPYKLPEVPFLTKEDTAR